MFTQFILLFWCSVPVISGFKPRPRGPSAARRGFTGASRGGNTNCWEWLHHSPYETQFRSRLWKENAGIQLSGFTQMKKADLSLRVLFLFSLSQEPPSHFRYNSYVI